MQNACENKRFCFCDTSTKNYNMEITLKRLDDAYLMEAVNENGNTLQIDGSKAIGGNESAFRPMQLLLAALGGCSSIDIISILKKQRQELTDIQVKVNGEREKGTEPSLFREIHVLYELKGNIDAEKAMKAATLSMEKYCSVAKTLEPTAKITWSLSVNGVLIKGD